MSYRDELKASSFAELLRLRFVRTYLKKLEMGESPSPLKCADYLVYLGVLRGPSTKFGRPEFAGFPAFLFAYPAAVAQYIKYKMPRTDSYSSGWDYLIDIRITDAATTTSHYITIERRKFELKFRDPENPFVHQRKVTEINTVEKFVVRVADHPRRRFDTQVDVNLVLGGDLEANKAAADEAQTLLTAFYDKAVKIAETRRQFMGRPGITAQDVLSYSE